MTTQPTQPGSMQPTPRCDEQPHYFHNGGEFVWVDLDFAQQLEREHAALSAALARSEERVKELEVSGFKILGQIRAAWEAGFRVCRSYGDNHAYFAGEQKEKLWAKYLELINADEKLANARENAATAALTDKLARSERELAEAKAEETRVSESIVNLSLFGSPGNRFQGVAEMQVAALFKRAESAEAALVTAREQLAKSEKKEDQLMDGLANATAKQLKAEAALAAATARCGEQASDLANALKALGEALSFRRFEHVLRKYDLIDPAALDDPEGFDNYRTHGAVCAAHRELVSAAARPSAPLAAGSAGSAAKEEK